MQTKDLKSKIKAEEIIFNVSLGIYPKEAIYATTRVFLERFYIFLDKDNSVIKISLTPKKGKMLNLKIYQNEFLNELLNNSLRFMISKRNQKIREIIVKEALFFSQPKEEIEKILLSQKQRKESHRWQDDPLGIAIPWEEKYGIKKHKK